jgi:phosphoribosyl-AMP cyclohydrolase / phosphoribosyl-ATP pyrophosphohydrolase
VIIPSIDLLDGQAVQLIGGRERAIEAGDPRPLATRFALAGEIALIDLNAALGRGDNRALALELAGRYPCRVGGGIRDYSTAVQWLDAGARKIILGTAAHPALLSRLPRERLIAALDHRQGEVLTHGWTRGSGRSVLERLAELRPYVGGFLITFVESEGRMQGLALDQVRPIVEAAGDVRVTAAGGVSSPDEIAALDALGVDAQVGMALYSGRMDLAEAIAAPLRSDRPDGLWPTVIVDEHEKALGLAYSNQASLGEAIRTGTGVYHSRRHGLWRKGATSGATQDLLRVDLDCDRDTLRFTVVQHGAGFCHRGSRTCWGQEHGLTHLYRRLRERREEAPEGSYTRRLLEDPRLLRAKLLEEAAELAEAPPGQAAAEAADLLYFALTALVRAGVDWAEVEAELDRRSLKVTRRPGDAKEHFLEAGGEGDGA